MRIIGIDPGLQITGYAILEQRIDHPHVCEAGILKPSADRKTADLAPRLDNLYNGVVEIVNQFEPAAMVVEQLYSHYNHPRTAILMAHARGVIFLAAAQQSIPVISYSATRIKKIITGHGRASKEQMQHAIQRELRLTEIPEPADVADALGVALCHYYLAKNAVA